MLYSSGDGRVPLGEDLSGIPNLYIHKESLQPHLDLAVASPVSIALAAHDKRSTDRDTAFLQTAINARLNLVKDLYMVHLNIIRRNSITPAAEDAFQRASIRTRIFDAAIIRAFPTDLDKLPSMALVQQIAEVALDMELKPQHTPEELADISERLMVIADTERRAQKTLEQLPEFTLKKEGRSFANRKAIKAQDVVSRALNTPPGVNYAAFSQEDADLLTRYGAGLIPGKDPKHQSWDMAGRRKFIIGLGAQMNLWAFDGRSISTVSTLPQIVGIS